MVNLQHKIGLLSNKELIKLSKELEQTTVPDNALIRDVIKNTEVETTVPMMAFIQVSGVLQAELAHRLKTVTSRVGDLKTLLGSNMPALKQKEYDRSVEIINEILDPEYAGNTWRLVGD